MEKLHWAVKLSECYQRSLALGGLLLWEQVLLADREIAAEPGALSAEAC